MHGQMQDVELVEQEPSEPVRRTPAGPRRAHRWRVPAVVVGVALVAALVTYQASADARARADLDRAATVPGTLLPLGDRLHTRWRPSGDGRSPAFAALAGRHLVAAETTADATLRVREVDRTDGEARWTVEVPVGAVAPRAGAPVTCAPLGDPARSARVVCAVAGPAPSTPDSPGPRPTAFVVLDADDGAVVVVRTVRTELWTVHGSRVVLASSHDDPAGTTWVVLATDLTAVDEPDPVWRTTTPPWDRPVVIGPDGQELAWQDLQAAGDRLLLTDGDHAWLLGSDGTLLTALDTGAQVATLGRTGVVGLVDWSAASGFDRPRATLVADGRTLTVRDTVQPPTVDDGSAPDVEVMQSFDGPVVVRSGRTGGELWRSREPVTATLLLGGVLYAASPDGVVARDAVTGRRVWAARGPDTRRLATDGRVLLALSPSLTVRAYGLADGAELWTQDARPLVDDGSGTARWLTTGWGMLAIVSPDGLTVVG
ncbi:hypothetical protein [Cellulomonas sp.]|uniref:hypothetical protein n=1 Tax=Cellulomonas sp. TaxID=40001 RepID=UPI001AFD5770|nr:hypothetical protein [Cellulomonas sp.]MBO9553014.1 PQQ-binding-like beta-propeller repeat protein [Cellulomonas sp.]